MAEPWSLALARKPDPENALDPGDVAPLESVEAGSSQFMASSARREYIGGGPLENGVFAPVVRRIDLP